MKEIKYPALLTGKDKIRHLFHRKHPFYLTWWIYPLVIFFALLLIFGVPIIINEVYKICGWYTTIWGASEALSFYAVVLSGIITVGSLITTIVCSQKNTEKQLRFYMAQTKTPFFKIISVQQNKNQDDFHVNDDNSWQKEYQVHEPGVLENGDIEDVEIVLENIGEGIALSPSYRIDMMGSSVLLDHVVQNNNYLTIKYNFIKNLNDKFVHYHFNEGFRRFHTGNVTHITRIHLVYQNIYGIQLKQTLQVDICFNYDDKKIFLSLHELSPQTILE